MVPRTVLALGSRNERFSQGPGAALIVDVAGSTALSAALRPHGTAGAEALADVLDSVFVPIVAHIASQGGDVAAFAGDGVLAVFHGELDEAVERALLAAQMIAIDLRSLGEQSTPAGSVRVTARCVIGAGSIEWRVWATEHTDTPQNATFACVGSAVDEAHAGEAVTPGGAMAIGPNALQGLSRPIATTPLDDTYRIVAPNPMTTSPAPSSALRTEEDGLHSSALRFFPPEMVDLTLRGEFREVVSVFLELVSTPSIDDVSPLVQVLDLLAERRGFLCNVVASGGEAIRVFALWGAPTSHEHHVGHAVRFTTDVQRELGPSEMRAAATRATAYVGFVGSDVQESYTAIGAGVNLAARMCSTAAWGDVVVDSAVADRLGEYWGLADLGELTYGGFDEPSRTLRIEDVPTVRRPDPFRGAFVGREADLDRLEDLLAPLWKGRSSGTIVVSGRAGVGKSRLLAELPRRLESHKPQPTWVAAQADEIRSQPLSTLRDAFEGYFGRRGDPATSVGLTEYLGNLSASSSDMAHELDRSRRALGDLLGLPDEREAASNLDPKTRFENIALAVRSLVLAASQAAPVIITIADAQWLDAGTADVIDRLTDALPDTPMAVIVETRGPHPLESVTATIDIAPLSRPEITELTTEFLGEEPPSTLVELIHERSEGNTLYARELLEYMADKHLLSADEDVGAIEGAVPEGLLPMLVARIDALTPPARRIVQTASVLGRVFEYSVLHHLVDELMIDDSRIAETINAGIWDTTDESHMAFWDLLVREAAYSMLLHSDARELHARAARAIKSVHPSEEDTAAELAHHFDRAGLHEESMQAHVTAARVAARRYSNDDALHHVKSVLELADAAHRSERVAALRLRHDIEDMVGDRSAQEITLQELERLVDDESVKLDLVALRGRLLVARGAYEEAETLISATQAGLADATTPERGGLTFLRAQVGRYRGEHDEAARHASHARTIFEDLGDTDEVATIDDFLGGLAWEHGEFREAIDLHRAAADAFHASGRVADEIRALNNLGTAIFSLGDYAAARVIHEDGARRSREIGYRMGEGDHLDNAGGTAWAVGDYDTAMDRYTEALGIREGMDDAWGVAISLGNIGSTLRATGEPTKALSRYRRALEIDREIGRRRGEAYDLHGIGLCHLDMDDLNLATEALEKAASVRFELGETHLASESRVACAVAMARKGDNVEAVELVERVLDVEGDDLFSGAVETTATLLRCIEVLELGRSERTETLRSLAAAKVEERARRISDPGQRASYLQHIESHREALADRDS